LLLGLLGIGAGVLLEKVIPDLWEAASDVKENEDGAGPVPSGSATSAAFDYSINEEAAPSSPGAPIPVDAEPDEAVSIGAGGVAEPVAAMASTAPANKSKSKARVVGDYVIVDDKKFPNNPEDYAKAIRTMMRKDD